MGDYFCAPVLAQCRVKLVDAFDSTTAYGSYSNLTIANVSSTISAGTFYYGSTLGSAKILYTDSESLDTYAVAAVSINGTASNLKSTTTFDSDPSSVVKIVIDQPSITLLATFPGSLPSVGADSSFVLGRLVSSGGDCNTTTYVPAAWYASWSVSSYGDVAYDQSALLTATGNHELMIARGKFRSRGTGAYYRDFSAYGGNPNYSSIPYTSSDFRFITFTWKVAGSDIGGSSINYGNMAFTISNALTGSLSLLPNQLPYFTGSAEVQFKMYYRFEMQYSNAGIDYRIPRGSTTAPTPSGINYTSDWIDMNDNANGSSEVNSDNYNTLKSTTGSPPSVWAGARGFSSNNIGGGLTHYTFTPKMPAANYITTTTYIYCRIVLPMNVDFEFTGISAKLVP